MRQTICFTFCRAMISIHVCLYSLSVFVSMELVLHNMAEQKLSFTMFRRVTVENWHPEKTIVNRREGVSIPTVALPNRHYLFRYADCLNFREILIEWLEFYSEPCAHTFLQLLDLFLIIPFSIKNRNRDKFASQIAIKCSVMQIDSCLARAIATAQKKVIYTFYI